MPIETLYLTDDEKTVIISLFWRQRKHCSSSNLFSSTVLFFFSRLKVPDSEVPPWISYGSGGRNNADISRVWNTEEKFRQNILEELIKDCLHMEVAGIVSSTLVVSMIQFRSSSAWSL